MLIGRPFRLARLAISDWQLAIHVRFATSRQNCVSLSIVMRWPFSRSRLISMSFRPPSRPAACSALGRPRTMTVVCADGPLWTMAPARLAARAPRCAACSGAGKHQMGALERSEHAGPQCRRRRRRASIISSALCTASGARRCIDRRSPSGGRCTRGRGHPRS